MSRQPEGLRGPNQRISGHPMQNTGKNDPVWDAVAAEEHRQETHLELIASENHTSAEVMAAMGTCLTDKYAEGYPGRRYYGGCQHVDEVETLCRERAKELFGATHANVQPHSGTQANVAAFMALLEPRARVLGMSLDHGGHLSHGHPKNFSGLFYDFHAYGVDRETERLDLDRIREQALELRPRMILAGASAYSRIIDFAGLAEIARECGALLMVDMAHIAGLVAGGLHPSPVPHADVVTMTTHKTLRGPRGGLILTTKAWIKKINSAVFPGGQGGPFMHVIAAKAVAPRLELQASGRDIRRTDHVGRGQRFSAVDDTVTVGVVVQRAGAGRGGDDHVQQIVTIQRIAEAEVAHGEDQVGIFQGANCVVGARRFVVDRRDVDGHGVGRLIGILAAVGSSAIVLYLERETVVAQSVGVGHWLELQASSRDIRRTDHVARGQRFSAVDDTVAVGVVVQRATRGRGGDDHIQHAVAFHRIAETELANRKHMVRVFQTCRAQSRDLAAGSVLASSSR